MGLLVVGVLWLIFLVLYPISYFLMRSNKVTPEERDLIKRWFFNFRFSFDNPVRTAFIPVASAIVLSIALHNFIPAYGLVTYDLSQLFVFSLFVFVVGEEVIYRGWLMSGFLNLRDGWTVGEFVKQGKKRIIELAIFVVVGALVFAMAHAEKIMPFSFGILMGIFFICENKNLVPSMLVHLTANAMVMLFYFGLI